MPEYSYIATDAEGNQTNGQVDAPSLEAAKQTLHSMNLTPSEVIEIPSDANDTMPEEVTVTYSPGEAYQSTLEQEPPMPAPAVQSEPVQWQTIDEDNLHTVVDTQPPLPAGSPHEQEEEEIPYFPIAETLRLYAGWLLAWYALVYALGFYQSTRELPFRIPYVEGLLLSPLVLTFAWAAFLFLLMSGLHSKAGGGWLKGLLFTVLGVVCFVVYRINV